VLKKLHRPLIAAHHCQINCELSRTASRSRLLVRPSLPTTRVTCSRSQTERSSWSPSTYLLKMVRQMSSANNEKMLMPHELCVVSRKQTQLQ
jgi:hypothetical protein